jgi:hypothetical protein
VLNFSDDFVREGGSVGLYPVPHVLVGCFDLLGCL